MRTWKRAATTSCSSTRSATGNKRGQICFPKTDLTPLFRLPPLRPDSPLVLHTAPRYVASSPEARMPRRLRISIPNMPHHLIHRGHRQQNIFFSDGDRTDYLGTLAECRALFGIKV